MIEKVLWAKNIDVENIICVRIVYEIQDFLQCSLEMRVLN